MAGGHLHSEVADGSERGKYVFTARSLPPTDMYCCSLADSDSDSYGR